MRKKGKKGKMKKFILVFLTYFKKRAIATMILLAMAFWLVFLTGCNSNLFSADVEETTKSKVSQVIQNESDVFVETRISDVWWANQSRYLGNASDIGDEYLSNDYQYRDVLTKRIQGNKLCVTDEDICTDSLSSTTIGQIDGDYAILIIDGFNYNGDKIREVYPNSKFVDTQIYILNDIENTIMSQRLDDWNSGEILVLAIPVEETKKNGGISNLNLGVSEFVIIFSQGLIIPDLKAPSIGGSVHASVDVDNQPSIDEIISHVYALDETDGYVPIEIESSTYVQGVMEVGDYTINISASDSSGNKSNGSVYVHRYDYTAPVINGTDSYDLNYDNDLTLAKIESALTIVDNVDSGLKLEKVSDTFTGNEHKIGDYQVVYRTKDKSNNMSANKTINISVKNKGTAVIGGAREIRVGTDHVLTLEEFKSNVSVVDGYDGIITNYTITGFDDYTATTKVVGTNIIEVSYTNSGGNTAIAEFSIFKEDKLAPGFLFDDYFIQLKQGEVFTRDMIMNQVATILNLDIAEIDSIKGEYDIMTLGNYEIDVCLTTGEKKAFTLSVVDEFGNTPSDKIIKNDFLSAEGYVDNLFKPINWSIYHYLTILGVVLVTIGIICLCVVHKKKNNQNDMYY